MTSSSGFGRGALSVAFGLAVAMPAAAHICVETPVSRAGEGCDFFSAQKEGPCGFPERSANVTEFPPGQTISIRVTETANHPSHFRVAFNPEGDDFEDPTSMEDMDGRHPYVLLDGIVDEDSASQDIQVTLPDVTCDNCTLQIIQVMYDKLGNGFGGNDGPGGMDDNDDIYYSCADLVLREGAGVGTGGIVARGGVVLTGGVLATGGVDATGGAQVGAGLMATGGSQNTGAVSVAGAAGLMVVGDSPAADNGGSSSGCSITARGGTILQLSPLALAMLLFRRRAVRV